MTRNPAVKRRAPYREIRTVGPVKLYLSDIDAIVSRLSKDAGEVVISAGTSSASTAQDLRDATRRELSSLMIQTDSPRVDIYLHPKRCTVESTQDDDFARSVLENAVSLVEQHRRSLFPRFLVQAAISLLVIGLLIVYFRLATSNQSQIVVALIFGVMILAMLAYWNWYSWRSYVRSGRTRLVLRDRQEASDRRVSMATTVWVGVGGAIAGGVLGGVATALLTNQP